MQADTVGKVIQPAPDFSNLKRGDLVFWPGHVGIMASATDLLHANAYWMRVVTEPLADVLAPEARLRAVSARGPLQVPGWPGYHWYLVPRVGYPDRPTFDASRTALAENHAAAGRIASAGSEPGSTSAAAVASTYSLRSVSFSAPGVPGAVGDELISRRPLPSAAR